MEDYYRLSIDPEARIAPNATLVGDIALERDVTILFNATLRAEKGGRIVVGEGTNIQEQCCLHIEYGRTLTVGRGTTVGHGAILHGCTIGDNTLVGMGAIVMNDAVVGDNCLIGAGALVPNGMSIPNGTLVVGMPAKLRRMLTDQEIAANRRSAEGYVDDGINLAENGIIFSGANLPATSMTIAIR